MKALGCAEDKATHVYLGMENPNYSHSPDTKYKYFAKTYNKNEKIPMKDSLSLMGGGRSPHAQAVEGHTDFCKRQA